MYKEEKIKLLNNMENFLIRLGCEAHRIPMYIWYSIDCYIRRMIRLYLVLYINRLKIEPYVFMPVYITNIQHQLTIIEKEKALFNFTVKRKRMIINDGDMTVYNGYKKYFEDFKGMDDS